MGTTHTKIKAISPQLLVADLERSLAFYTRQLGFEIDFLYEDFYAGITHNVFSIHLKQGNITKEERENKLKNEHLDLIFSVGDIIPLFENMQNRPVVIIQPLREMPYGREFYIADPDGYLLGFIESE